MKLWQWLALIAFSFSTECIINKKLEQKISQKITQETIKVKEPAILKQPKDAGDFSLRFGYGVGKAYAQDSTGISPDDTRHIFNKLIGWFGYYAEKGNLEKAMENIKALEELFTTYEQNKKIQLAKITLYNILSEHYIEQYKKTENKFFLDSAEIYNKKVFDEVFGENCSPCNDVPSIEKRGIEKKIKDETKEAYNVLGIIIREK